MVAVASLVPSVHAVTATPGRPPSQAHHDSVWVAPPLPPPLPSKKRVWGSCHTDCHRLPPAATLCHPPAEPQRPARAQSAARLEQAVAHQLASKIATGEIFRPAAAVASSSRDSARATTPRGAAGDAAAPL
ncbi:unnamed protein product [Lampetra planeri]